MEGLKTVLFYLLGLAGLIIASMLFTGQVEVEINDLPTPTAVATPTVVAQADCPNPVRNVNSNSYLPDAPFTTQLAPPDDPGERLIVSGTIYQADEITPAANALIEIWQTDAKGRYSRAGDYTFRAQLRTDEAGRYQFTTLKPGHFQVDCHFLPAHIHYKISYQDRRPLFASLYFEGDPYLAGALLVTPRLIKPLERREEPEGPVLYTTFDVILPAVPAS
jgi:catechol 1,2-dioxygenase